MSISSFSRLRTQLPSVSKLRTFSTTPWLRADASSSNSASEANQGSLTNSSPFKSPLSSNKSPQFASGLDLKQVRKAEEPANALPTSDLDSAALDAKWAELSHKEITDQQRSRIHAELTPYSSRTELVSGNYGVSAVTAAWKSLNRTLAESGIRRELRLTERFERPTFKRQRLASERHRRRFKAQVGKEITGIMRLKKKGL